MKILFDFSVKGQGFRLDYHKEGIKECKEDKYFLYFVDKKKKHLMICLREDECILLSALLNFGVHKKLVDIDRVGIERKKFKTKIIKSKDSASIIRREKRGGKDD